MPRFLRIDRSLLPNCFRKVDTHEVWNIAESSNTEYHYGFRKPLNYVDPA
jgi:hypothetical protein